MNISIFGLGYVGCVSLGCLANSGHNVIGVDVDQEKIDLINSGRATIVENKISEIINQCFLSNRIEATKDYDYAVRNSNLSIICVGTPSTSEGKLNLDYIKNVSEQIGSVLSTKSDFHTIVIRSTVPPGTNKELCSIVSTTSGKIIGKDFAVVSNPEFLREGTAVSDYYNPPMIIVGSNQDKGLEMIKRLYQDIDCEYIITDVEIAEFIKYVNNTFHALKVSFANEIGNICKKLEIDSHKLMEIFISDTKLNISPYYLKPGFAYGGSCLPKDLKALNNLSDNLGLKSHIIDSIKRSNDNQKAVALSLIREVGLKKIGFLGTSFKEGTDDIRNSPVIDLISELIKNNYDIKIFDMEVSTSIKFGSNKSIIDHMSFDFYSLIDNDIENFINFADVIVISKKDNIFKIVEKYMDDKVIIDFVRLFEDFKHPNYIGLCW